MSEEKFTPKGQPLTLAQLLELTTIRQSDTDEMVKTSHPTIESFIDAVPIRRK